MSPPLHHLLPIQVMEKGVWSGKKVTRYLVPPLLPIYCMTFRKSVHFLGLNFPIWEINFENLQFNFGINDFTPTLLEGLGVGRGEKQYTQHAMQRGEWSGWIKNLWRKAMLEAGQLCSARCEH